MTHTSDTGYMHRATGNTWVLLFMIQHLYRYDRFGALNYKRLMRFELRSLVTILMFFGILLQCIYDYGILEIKYNVGYFALPNTGVVVGAPGTGVIIDTPFQVWTDDQKERTLILNYFLAMAEACDSSMLFMLQSFWAYISKSIARTDFMSSIEYKLTLTWSCLVMFLFPLIQWVFRNDPIARELAPQLTFSVNDFVLGAMGIRAHFRFNAVIKSTRETNNENARTVIAKLEYYQFMNTLLTIGMWGSGFTLGAICVDGLFSHPYINTHKWASDFLITQVNLFEPVMFLSIILILYPRKTSSHANFGNTTKGSKGSTVAAQTSHHQNASHARYQQDDGYHTAPIHLESINNYDSGKISYNESAGRSPHDQYQSNQRPLSNSYNSRSTTDTSATRVSQAKYPKVIKMSVSQEAFDQTHDQYVQSFSDTDHLTNVRNSPPSAAAMQAGHQYPQLAHQLSQNHLNIVSNNNVNHQQNDGYYQGLQNVDPANTYHQGDRPSLSIPRAQSPVPVGLPRQQFSDTISPPTSPITRQPQQYQEAPVFMPKSTQRNMNGNGGGQPVVQYLSQPSR